jgi:predicted signal transduction protein with EAL and GGDEF domain
MSSDSAVNRASDPHLLAADLIDAAQDRFLKPVALVLMVGAGGALPLIYLAPRWLWLEVPLFIIVATAIHRYQLRRWWNWASAHDIEPEFLLGAAREAELSVPERWVKTSARA